MSDAFVYMFVVGAGASSGVAVVGFAAYRIFTFMQGKAVAPRKNGKRTRGIV